MIQNRLIGERILIGLGGALERGMDRRGNTEFVLGGLNMQNGRAKRSAGREIEGKSDGRENALVIDGKGSVGMLVMGEGTKRDKLSGLRRNVNRP